MKPSQDYRNVGSCPSLTGNIAIFQCFVATRNNSWTNSAKESTKAKIIEAEEWLQRECSRYGHEVCFKNFSFEDQFFDTIPYGPDSHNAGSFALRVLEKIGYNSTDNSKVLMKQAGGYQCDKLIFMAIVNGEGRNYANPYSKFLEDYNATDYFVESCVLFRKYRSVNCEIYSSSIAHEILHVCGAWDLYADSLTGQSESAQKRATELFPNSIMIKVPYNINDAIIDELTAWLVGISTNYRYWYESFEPKM